EVESAAQAATALRPLAGDLAYVLMAIGLIGSGMLAVPVLTTSVAYAVSETFGWPWGLSRKPKQAVRFYLVISGATIAALVVSLSGINPMAALVWAAIINGLLAPPLLFVAMLVSNNRSIMGKQVNSLPV